MPLAGELDIRPLLDGAPSTTLSDRELRVEGVRILQLLHEVAAIDAPGLLPAALNPTIPPVISFLAWSAADSELGPFSLVQARITARAGVRPRAFLVSAVCDNPAVAELLSGAWGFRIRPGETTVRTYHDRIELVVREGRATTLEIALVDPEPITGHDVQYAPGMHLARLDHDGSVRPRLLQVDVEYEFKKADRGRPRLVAFEREAWGCERVTPTEPISASFSTCDVTIPVVHYVANPDLPAAEGTERVGTAPVRS